MISALRYAVRSLLKSPGFTVVALVTLALGIGVNTAMFSFVNSLLFKAAPYPQPNQLVRIFRTSPQSKTWPHSAADLVDLHAQVKSFEHFSYFQWATFSLAEPGQAAERISGLSVSAEFLATLAVQPSLGRGFTPEDQVAGHNDVIVLSQRLWESRFGGDPTVVGRLFRIDGRPVTVIGVMPAGADYPLLWGRVDAWMPLALSGEQRQDRGSHYLGAIGRLKAGTTMAAAETELTGLSTHLATQYPETNENSGIRLVRLHDSTMDDTGRKLSYLVLGLSGFVLLIACANLANLQLARTAIRARDYAIRTALGASRARIVRELLLESVLLALVGGAIGLLMAQWMTDFLGRQVTVGEDNGLIVALDLRVLGFALLASLATGILFGVMPAWVASRSDVNAALKQQSRGSTGDRSQHRLRHGLIVAEIALALALLAGAGFFVRGLQRFTHQDLGWDRDQLLIAQVNLPDSSYSTLEKKRAFQQQLEARLAAIPGVEHAAVSSSLPLWAYNSSRDIVAQDKPLPPRLQTPIANYISVSSDFFATLQISFVQGSGFPVNVRPEGPRIAIVNETLARQFWPGENPIGKRIGSSDPTNKDWDEVVGVVRDVGFAGNLSAPETRLQVYRPLLQEPWNFLSIALRSSAPPTSLASSLRAAVTEVDPDLPAYRIRTVRDAIGRMEQNYQLSNQLLSAFAVLGLLLAAIGLYGVISGLVVQRTAEFGIRLALGAQTRDVLWLVLGKGLRLAALGTVLGLVASFGLLRVLASMLPALPGQDLVLLAATVVTLLGVALFASWLPARRATKVDPIVALRAE